ncbi:gluconate 2-dehydrogenase subunit 3 family protein [Niabella aquatica]
MGGAVLGGELFIQTGCRPSAKEGGGAGTGFFNQEKIAFLDEIAETIIPRTETPGAKDAGVGEFMNVMVRDCYTPDDQEIFRKGLDTIEAMSKEQYGNGFMQLTPEQRTLLLTALDKEANEYTQTSEYKSKRDELAAREAIKDSVEKRKGNFSYVKAVMPKHYFSMMKELTLLGFFTSEPGATKALRYAAVPGKYDPCMPYTKGDKGWAT